MSSSDQLPTRGRLAGIDFGTVRIGIAVCDVSQTLASPFACYRRQSPAQDSEYFRRLVAAQQIVGFVIGLPIHMSGEASQKSQEASEFGRWLATVTGLPLTWIDERYTSALAHQLLSTSSLSLQKRRKKLDQVAAQIILQSYLDSSRHGQGEPIGQPLDDR